VRGNGVGAVMQDQKKCTVVVVDDDPGVLKALTLLLQAFHWSVVPFSAPEQAVSYLRDNPVPDLILSDLRMPAMSGIELLASVRGITLSVPFVLMSGHATPQETDVARNLGMNGFLSKPFTPHQLQELLQNVPARAASV
jgi:CheY-like chemotaxis protein